MRKGSCVIYEGKFYRVQQKKGNTVIFYDPTSRTPEATMHATSIINVKEARPENGYIITQYTTPAGAVRVEIRPAKDPTWPWIDIPYTELHAHVLEILKTTSGAWFMDQRTTTACEYIPEYIQPDPLPEESNQDMRRFTIYTDSNMAGIDSRGAYTTLAEARMRLEKELDEDETSRGGYIFDELRQKVTAIYNGFNLEKIPEPYRGTPNEYTTKKERAMLESIMNKYSSEPTPATSPEANQDTTTGAQDGPTAPESNTAGENTTGTDKAPEEATQRRRQAFIVECRSPRGDWKRYSDEQPTHEAAEKIKEEAENRHALTAEGAPIFYRLVTIDKGPEQIMTPQGSPTTAGTIAADTRTAGATKATPQGKERATAAGGIAAQMKNANKPGHACENAPGRTERAQAEQVHTPHAKRPPRAPQRATTHGRPRGHPEKTANFVRFYPLLDFPRTIFANFQGVPISVCIFGPVFDPEFWSPKPDPLGGIKISCNPRRKNFQKIFLDGGKYNGKIHNACT